MRLCETLPKPEVIAQQIATARRERDLLRRLYRLSLDARAVHRELRETKRPVADDREGGDHE